MKEIPPVLRGVPRRWQYLTAGQTYPRHYHGNGHLSIVLSGEFDEAGDHGRWRIKPGHVLFRPAFSSHAQRVARPAHIFNVGLPSDLFLPFQYAALDDPERVVDELQRDLHHGLSLLAERARPLTAPAEEWPDLLAVALAQGTNIRDWASENQLHPASLARRFRSIYGASPARYRTEQRARRAWRQIIDTGVPLTNVAYGLGFSDQAHMCREVRALTGLSANQWRRLKRFNTPAGGACDQDAMDRRAFNSLGAIGTGLLLSSMGRPLIASSVARKTSAGTSWSVIESEGYDALCFWAPLGGDPAALQQYSEEVAAFLPNFDPKALAAIKALYKQTAAAGNVLTHSACRHFSAGPHRTIDDLIHSARNNDALLKPRHLADPEWEGEEMWERYRQLMPVAMMILEAMKAAGFPEFRRKLYQGKHAARTSEVHKAVAPYNVVSEVQLLTGRTFAPGVEIALTYFSYPRGMRMLGQQFVTWAGYSDDTILNTSAHELMHPPLNLRGQAMRDAITILSANPFLVRIVGERDPSLGDVGDLPNYVEECMVQALDQIASDRRGSKRKAKEFFSRNKGADVLAACFYGLLKQDNYHRTGGNFEQWVTKAVAAGRFESKSLGEAGTKVLGSSPAAVWQPFHPPQAS